MKVGSDDWLLLAFDDPTQSVIFGVRSWWARRPRIERMVTRTDWIQMCDRAAAEVVTVAGGVKE